MNVRLYDSSIIRKFTQLKALENSEQSSPITPLPIINDEIQKKEYKFTILGEPLALARHRTTKFGMVYNPSAKAQKAFELLSLPHLPAKPLEGPLEAEICFYFSRPKLHYRTGKFSDILKPGVARWYSKKPGK